MKNTTVLFIVCIFLSPYSAFAAYSPFVETQSEATAQSDQQEVAGRFRRCFQRNLHMGRPAAAIHCGQVVRLELEQSPFVGSSDEQLANWGFWACAWERMAMGDAFADVAGLCETLSSVEEPNVAEEAVL